MLGMWSWHKLQALVYDHSSLCRKVPESDARSVVLIQTDTNSKHWFTTSFLCRKVPESDAWSVVLIQTPSTGLRHPSFAGKCRKAMLGVWYTDPNSKHWFTTSFLWRRVPGKRCLGVRSWHKTNSKHWFTTSFLWNKVPESDARSVVLTQTPSTGLRHPSFGGRCRKAMLGVWYWHKLQALVYDILPLEEGVGKRCSEYGTDTNSKHWFTTSFLWNKVPESDVRSMVLTQTPSTGLRHPSFRGVVPESDAWSVVPNTNSKHWFTTSFL